jgi:hypothetical protein
LTGNQDDIRVQVSRSELSLYERLLNELGGAFGREIESILGRHADEVFERIHDRVIRRLRAPGIHLYELDEIDMAVVRALVPIVLWRFDEGDFKTITGHTFNEVSTLRGRAETVDHRVFLDRNQVVYRPFKRQIRFPMIDAPLGDRLVLVPDAASWETIWEDQTRRSIREEVLGEISRWGQRRWRDGLRLESRSIRDLAELEVEALQIAIARRRTKRESRRARLIWRPPFA